jgi:hypothetical protein
MSTEVKTYASDQVVMIIGGVPLTGFADGTFVEIEQLGDGTSSQSGGDGEIARAFSPDKRYQVTITLQQTSSSNDILGGLLQADEITRKGIFPVLIEDLSGRTVFAASQAWVNKNPNAPLSKSLENRAWVLTTGAPLYTLAGN